MLVTLFVGKTIAGQINPDLIMMMMIWIMVIMIMRTMVTIMISFSGSFIKGRKELLIAAQNLVGQNSPFHLSVSFDTEIQRLGTIFSFKKFISSLVPIIKKFPNKNPTGTRRRRDRRVRIHGLTQKLRRLGQGWILH